MVWKVVVSNNRCTSSIEEYVVCADNIGDAEKKAVRQAYEYWEEYCEEQFVVVSVWVKVK
jgi:hypothetical protein